MKNQPLITDENACKYTLYFILGAFLFRLCIAIWTGLGIGESYYYGGARVLELSYFDQPPLFMWLSGLLMRVFGESNVVLRLPALCLFSGTSWVIFLLTRQFFSAAAGFYSVMLLSLSGVFLLSGTWFQPDAPLMFFWICYIYCLSQIIFLDKKHMNLLTTNKQTQIYWWLILSGLMLGLTILSKYHAIFLLIGLFLFLITSNKSRHWLLHPGLYLSIILGLIVALPVFIWNYHHHFVSFLFQGDRALDGGIFKLHLDWFLRSFLGQALWITPWIWLPLIMQLVKAFKLRNHDARYGFCFWMALTPLVFFTVATLWADLQYHFHWQAPGYMMLYIPLGKMVEDKIMQNQYWRNIMHSWLIFSLSVIVVVFIFVSLHTETGFWTWYGPKWMSKRATGIAYDQTMDGYDYTDLRSAFVKNGWLNNPHIFVATTHWWLSGKVDWALRGNKDIVCFDGDARNYMYFFDPKKIIGKDAIVITRGKDNTVASNIAPFCDSLIQLPDIAIIRSGVDELNLHSYKCKDFHLSATARHDLPVYNALIGQLP